MWFPSLAADIKVKRRHDPVLVAMAYERHAMRSVIRGDDHQRRTQNRSAHVVASTVQTLQKQAVSDILVVSNAMPVRTALIAWQWDETKQKTLMKWTLQLAGAQTPSMTKSIDVMVGSGKLCVWNAPIGMSVGEPSVVSPFFAKPIATFRDDDTVHR